MQQNALSDMERKNGYKRPFRTKITHSMCGKDTLLTVNMAEVMASDPRARKLCHCTYCGEYRPNMEFTWTGTNEMVGT